MTECSRARRESSGAFFPVLLFFAVLLPVLAGCPQPHGDAPEPEAGTGGDAGEILYPVFPVEETENAEGYELEIASSPDFSETSIVYASGAAFFETPAMSPDADFTAGTRYYWRARAYAGGRPGPWSGVGTFVLTDPGLSDAEAPGTAKFSGLPAGIAWAAPESAAAFHLQVSPAGDFGGGLLVDVRDIREGGFSLGGLLSPGERYFWRIRARGEAGTWGAWSPVFASFAPPELSLTLAGCTATRAFMSVAAVSAEVVPAEAGIAWGPAGFAAEDCGMVPLRSNAEGVLSVASEGGLADLAPASTYTVRAYAVCEGVVVYGAAVNFSTSADYSVGDRGPAGGTVFYAKSASTDGWRYLEAAPADIGSFPWAPMDLSYGSTNPAEIKLDFLPPQEIGKGKSNTDYLVTKFGTAIRYAALACAEYSRGGYDDWFLPSFRELNAIYCAGSLIGGLSPDLYISSSAVLRVDSAGFDGLSYRVLASCMKFDSGATYESSTYHALKVRPVRAF